jgi:beta-lactamase regulating signal transducer with metallopeptidase domain
MIWLVIIGAILIVLAAALSFQLRKRRNSGVHLNSREREESSYQNTKHQHRKHYDIGSKGNQPPIQ